MKEKTFIGYQNKENSLLKLPFTVKFIYLIIVSIMIVSFPVLILYVSVFLIHFLINIISGIYIQKKALIFATFLSIPMFAIICFIPKCISSGFGLMEIIQIDYLYFFLICLKWLSLISVGIAFLSHSTSTQLIDTLIELKINKKIIITIVLSLNTIVYVFDSLPEINKALMSRGYKKNMIFKIRYIFQVVFIESLSRISDLKAYYLLNSEKILDIGD